jgi:hypothetical protein
VPCDAPLDDEETDVVVVVDEPVATPSAAGPPHAASVSPTANAPTVTSAARRVTLQRGCMNFMVHPVRVRFCLIMIWTFETTVRSLSPCAVSTVTYL